MVAKPHLEFPELHMVEVGTWLVAAINQVRAWQGSQEFRRTHQLGADSVQGLSRHRPPHRKQMHAVGSCEVQDF